MLSVPELEVLSSPVPPGTTVQPHGIEARPFQTREKSKRPQLSCNACRSRKVKCDRVQPCTACSLHQIAELCHYDLTEGERHPILQAEALKEKDREIARLELVIEQLNSNANKSESSDSCQGSRIKRKIGPALEASNKQTKQKHKRLRKEGSPGTLISPTMGNVIQEFTNLSVDAKAAHSRLSGSPEVDNVAMQMATSHPFPTLWPARDGVDSLIQLLADKEELHTYLNAYESSAHSSTFSLSQEECSKARFELFLSNIEHNARVHPDLLALLFATLAHGRRYSLEDAQRGFREDDSGESKKGDVFIAASMQALRTASFMNRPTVLVIQTLLAIGTYLTCTSKFLDAWALFGITIRLAQGLGLHRTTSPFKEYLPSEEVELRRNLWWHMLHVDQQFSVALDRPLGIASLGDLPVPQPHPQDQVLDSLRSYTVRLTILARKILSVDYLCDVQIDNFTDQLLRLEDILPAHMRFNKTWVNMQTAVPQAAVAAKAASLYVERHNLLTLINRQRLGDAQVIATKDSAIDLFAESSPTSKIPRGRERVLDSCRATLYAFEFFNKRLRPYMACWTLCQRAFKAAKILTISMLETAGTSDLIMVEQSYRMFFEIESSGTRRIAATTLDKLGDLLECLRTGIKMEEEVTELRDIAPLGGIGLEGRSLSLPSPLLQQTLEESAALGNHDQNRSFVSVQHTMRAKAQRKSLTGSAVKPKGSTRNLAFKQRRDSTNSQRHSGLWMNEPWQLDPVPAPNQESTLMNPATPATLTYPDTDMQFDHLDSAAGQQNLSPNDRNALSLGPSLPDQPVEENTFDPPSQSGFGIFHRSPSFARLCATLGTGNQPMNSTSYIPNAAFQPHQPAIRAPIKQPQTSQSSVQSGIYHPAVYSRTAPIDDPGYSFHPAVPPAHLVQPPYMAVSNQANTITQRNSPPQNKQEEQVGYCWPVDYMNYAEMQ